MFKFGPIESGAESDVYRTALAKHFPYGSIVEFSNHQNRTWYNVPLLSTNNREYIIQQDAGIYIVVGHNFPDVTRNEVILLTHRGDLIRESMGFILNATSMFKIHV